MEYEERERRQRESERRQRKKEGKKEVERWWRYMFSWVMMSLCVLAMPGPPTAMNASNWTAEFMVGVSVAA